MPADPTQAMTVWYNMSSFPVVAQPALTTTGNQTAYYQPVSAAVLEIPGSGSTVSVFWAEKYVASDSAYKVIKGVSRSVGDSWKPSLQELVMVQLTN